MTEIKLPDLGEGIDGGDVLKVLVAVGDAIQVEQSIVEVETDKATIEVPSPAAGTVTSLVVQEGERATTGQVLLVLEASAGGSVAARPAPAQTAGTASAVTADVAAKAATPPPPAAPASRATAAVTLPARPSGAPAAAAPSVRRIAREIGVAIDEVTGTGSRRRISAEDVKAHARRLLQRGGAGASGGAILAAPLPDLSRWGSVERKPMTRIREVTAEHLGAAWATIPHVTQHDEADVTELDRFRRANARRAEKRGAKLTVTAMLLKVSAAALRAFPDFNSSIDMRAREIVYKDYVHIGIAVDTPHGLLVPVLRDVDEKRIFDLAIEMGDLAERARERKVKPNELQGGCFTITNLGGIGGTAFTPIVNSPEVAILGVSRTQTRPVWNGTSFQPRQMLPLALSYDHRVIDGAAAARFLRWIAEGLEQPMSMLL